MNKLEERILSDGRVLPGEILKVDNFLNHQIDISLMEWIGEEFKHRFGDCGVTKVLTLEASGIPPAVLTAYKYNVPLVFAKKAKSGNLGDQDLYRAAVKSYTYGNEFTVTVVKKYLSAEDTVLIIDDFLAKGEACSGLLEICRQAGAKVAGIGICIEKGFQPGGQKLRETGLQVESLAIIDSMTDDSITFRAQD